MAKVKDSVRIFEEKMLPLLKELEKIAIENEVPYLNIIQIRHIPDNKGETEFKTFINGMPKETHPILISMCDVMKGVPITKAFKFFIMDEVSSLLDKSPLGGFPEDSDDDLISLLLSDPKAKA